MGIALSGIPAISFAISYLHWLLSPKERGSPRALTHRHYGPTLASTTAKAASATWQIDATTSNSSGLQWRYGQGSKSSRISVCVNLRGIL